jgi:hypothetical protein
MEWTKIKVQHFLFTDFELSHHGTLVRLLCLTAHLERMPTEKEMVKVTHYKSLTSLQQKLNEHSIDLQQVLNKVLEDAQSVQRKRDLNRSRQTSYRENHEKDNALHNATEDIRGDKSIYRETSKKPKQTKTTKPTLEEVTSFINEGSYKVCGATFFDYYEANGWMIGKSKMKDWKATIRNWDRRNKGVVQKERPKI